MSHPPLVLDGAVAVAILTAVRTITLREDTSSLALSDGVAAVNSADLLDTRRVFCLWPSRYPHTLERACS